MNNYDKRKLISDLMYLDVNNTYGWAMCEKLPMGGFKWVKDLSQFNENSNKGYFLEVDDEYPKNLFNLYKDFSKNKNRKGREACLQYKRQRKICCSHKNFKQALNNGLVLKRVHRVIEFNQKAWLKPYIVMNTKLRNEAKNEFEKDFFQLMNNAAFGKTMENVRTHRDIKLVTTMKKEINWLQNQILIHQNTFQKICWQQK